MDVIRHPILIYDGECAFCRFWAERWRRRMGENVEFEAYQTVAVRYPSISVEQFARAVYLIDEHDQSHRGAAAVFKLWSYRSRFGKIVWWTYRRIPLFAPVSEAGYRFVAKHRPLFWRLTCLFYDC